MIGGREADRLECLRAKSRDTTPDRRLENDLPRLEFIRRGQSDALWRVEPREELSERVPERIEGWEIGKLMPQHVLPLRQDRVAAQTNGLESRLNEGFERTLLT